MEKKSFTSGFSAAISADDAMKKIGNVPEWWGVTFTGSTQHKNDVFTVKMTGDSFFQFTVEELVPGKRIVWAVTDCHMPWYQDKTEWRGTKLIFELSGKGGVTEVVFTHEGLTPEVECYKDCDTGWTHWIGTSLFSYLTNGKGIFRPPTK